jgi:hypothetical protein
MKRVWRGRVRDRVWKAFVALAGQDVSTRELCRWTWPRRSRFETCRYYRVRRAAGEIAEPVRRGGGEPATFL